MDNPTPEPNDPKENIDDLLDKLGKKLDEDSFNLLELGTEDGLKLERMHQAKLLLELCVYLGALFTEENWKQFAQLVLDDKKIARLIGDMKLHIQENHPHMDDDGDHL